MISFQCLCVHVHACMHLYVLVYMCIARTSFLCRPSSMQLYTVEVPPVFHMPIMITVFQRLGDSA